MGINYTKINVDKICCHTNGQNQFFSHQFLYHGIKENHNIIIENNQMKKRMCNLCWEFWESLNNQEKYINLISWRNHIVDDYRKELKNDYSQNNNNFVTLLYHYQKSPYKFRDNYINYNTSHCLQLICNNHYYQDKNNTIAIFNKQIDNLDTFQFNVKYDKEAEIYIQTKFENHDNFIKFCLENELIQIFHSLKFSFSCNIIYENMIRFQKYNFSKLYLFLMIQGFSNFIAQMPKCEYISIFIPMLTEYYSKRKYIIDVFKHPKPILNIIESYIDCIYFEYCIATTIKY